MFMFPRLYLLLDGKLFLEWCSLFSLNSQHTVDIQHKLFMYIQFPWPYPWTTATEYLQLGTFVSIPFLSFSSQSRAALQRGLLQRLHSGDWCVRVCGWFSREQCLQRTWKKQIGNREKLGSHAIATGPWLTVQQAPRPGSSFIVGPSWSKTSSFYINASNWALGISLKRSWPWAKGFSSPSELGVICRQ